MVWVRLDDHFDQHPKIARVGPLGVALWVAGLAYCNRNMTDGFIPWSAARSLISWEFLGNARKGHALGSPERPAAESRTTVWKVSMTSGMVGDDVDTEFVIGLLIEAGLWTEIEQGYEVHDYTEYQPTREEIEAERDAKRRAGAAGGMRSAQMKRAKVYMATTHDRLQAPAQAPALAGAQAPAQAESKPVPVPVPEGKEKDASSSPSETQKRRRADAPRQPSGTKTVGHPAVQACTDAFRVNLPAWKPAGRDVKVLVDVCARNGIEVVSRWIQGPLWDHCQRFPYLERMGYGAAALAAQEHVLQKMDQDNGGGSNGR